MTSIEYRLDGRLTRQRGEIRFRRTGPEVELVIDDLLLQVAGPEGDATVHLRHSGNPAIPLDVDADDCTATVVVTVSWGDPDAPAALPAPIDTTGS